jgi:ABC-type multidrug transport system fused ATPase/permease subunit
MRRLFKLAFQQHHHRWLLALIIVAMAFATFATQLEMFALGVVTKRGPDFFELFAPLEQGQLQKTDLITKEQLEKRWDQIDKDKKGFVTNNDTTQFLEGVKKSDLLERGIAYINHVLPISSNFTALAIFLIFVAIFRAVTLFVHRFSTRLVSIYVSKNLRHDYFKHIQSLPMSFYQKHNTGGLSSRVVGDAAQIGDAVNACLVNYIQTPFTVITTLIICFLTSWQLTLVVFFGLPLIIFPIVFLARRVKRISKQIQQNQERFASVLIDFLSGIQTVKVFAMEEFSMRKYKDQNDHMAVLERRSARYDLSSRPIVHTVAMLFLSCVLMVGLYVLQLGVSTVLFYCGMIYIFYEPIKKFAEENSHIQRGIAAAERMFEVMDQKPQILDREDAKELEAFNQEITFDNVWFKYDQEWILKGLSFKVKKGETVALVGPTGAGKSTIVQLLPRLYEIQQGTISIDGKPLQAYTQKSIREKIAFVPQRPFLFYDTIAQNIAYGVSYTLEEIQEAAKKAHADEFISKMPQGYATPLAETGKNLSGGQQQRLAIARALVKNAPILIMDEATSSLDNISEHHIKTAIKKLRGQMTQIIIAHRLSTIEDADRIIYLEQGQKMGEGTKDELLTHCPGFRRMWEMMHKETSEIA